MKFILITSIYYVHLLQFQCWFITLLSYFPSKRSR